MICNTPIAFNGSMVHTLQYLAANIPWHHQLILPRAIMHIFTWAKWGLHSIFKCYHNMLISKVISCEMSELHEFYSMSPKNGKVQLLPPVPQIAVTKLKVNGQQLKITKNVSYLNNLQVQGHQDMTCYSLNRDKLSHTYNWSRLTVIYILKYFVWLWETNTWLVLQSTLPIMIQHWLRADQHLTDGTDQLCYLIQ